VEIRLKIASSAATFKIAEVVLLTRGRKQIESTRVAGLKNLKQLFVEAFGAACDLLD